NQNTVGRVDRALSQRFGPDASGWSKPVRPRARRLACFGRKVDFRPVLGDVGRQVAAAILNACVDAGQIERLRGGASSARRSQSTRNQQQGLHDAYSFFQYNLD